jgi:hypothetical protein
MGTFKNSLIGNPKIIITDGIGVLMTAVDHIISVSNAAFSIDRL